MCESGVTPIEEHGGYLVKRDDLFQIAGVRGGKVRTCWNMTKRAGLLMNPQTGSPKGLITAGSRMSPQVNIVAHIAQALKIPCRVHVPSGPDTPELEDARKCGAEVIQHTPGHNSVIVARAREDRGAHRLWLEIPFGMECSDAVSETKEQVANIPQSVNRIVIPVGSGMSLAGVLTGMRERGIKIPVLGVVVGADPSKRLARYAPLMWEQDVELVRSQYDYHAPAGSNRLGGIVLDPIYEAKCLPFLKAGDLLWVVGIRRTAEI